MRTHLLWTLFFLITFAASCASEPAKEFQPLIEQQPIVLHSEPPDGSQVENPVNFLLHFSERLDIQSIGPLSVLLVRNGWSNEFTEDAKSLIESLEGQELETIPLHYELEGEEKTLRLTPEFPLENGRYYLAVTPRLSSVKGIPFNQSPGASPQAWAASYFLGFNLEDSISTDPPSSPYRFGPAPQFLVINEILYDGKLSETDGEAFIELMGTPGADISDYEIFLINGADGGTTERITLPEGSLLSGTGVFVIADLDTNSTESSKVIQFDLLDQFDPQNGPDAVHLFDRNGNLLDALCYGEGAVAITPSGVPLGEGDPASDAPAGSSLSRRAGIDTEENHLDFFEKETPTPGNP